MRFALRHVARSAVATILMVVLLVIAPMTPAGAHQWRRVQGVAVLTVADADAHRWTVRLKVERTRSGTAEITTSCFVQIPTRTHEVVGFGKTVTIPQGEPSVNVMLGHLERFPQRDPPAPDAV